MKSNAASRYPAIIEELLSKVHAGAVDTQRALMSLGDMISAGMVSLDCAHGAWLEIIEVDCRNVPPLQTSRG